MKLVKEEKDILDALEKGKLKSTTPSKKEMAAIKTAATNTLKKDRRVTIRLYDHDLKRIQRKAMEKEIPYQTLISSIIHQYVEGELVEKRAG